MPEGRSCGEGKVINCSFGKESIDWVVTTRVGKLNASSKKVERR